MLTFSERVKLRENRGEGGFWTTPLSKFSEKLAGRAYAEMRGVAVPRLYWTGATLAECPIERLPRFCVVKPTSQWSCKGVYLLTRRAKSIFYDDHRQREFTWKEIVADVDSFDRPVMVEERIGEGVPLDYKFHMFGDHVGAIQVIDRPRCLAMYYTENWEPIRPKLLRRWQDAEFPKPPRLEDLVSAARQLACPTYMRIDLYATDIGPYFGELTPTPEGGRGYTGHGDQYLGELWERLIPGEL